MIREIPSPDDQRVFELELEVTRLRFSLDAITKAARTLQREIDAMNQKMPDHATEDKEGWINSYRIPVGPWHRILGISRGSLESALFEAKDA